MVDPGEALASVLSTMHPRDRPPFLRYLTRKGEWAGNRMYLEEIAAYCDRLAAEGGDETPPPTAVAASGQRLEPRSYGASYGPGRAVSIAAASFTSSRGVHWRSAENDNG